MKIINLRSVLFLLFIVLSSGLLFSCRGTDKQETTKNEADSVAVKTETVIETVNPSEEYHTFVASLDTTQMSSSKKAVEKYKELYATATSEQADEGFLIFDRLYNSIAFNLDEQHYKNGAKNGKYDKYDQIAGIYNGYNDGKDAPPEMIAYNNELASHGFGIGMTEGSTFVLQNRDFLKDTFYDKVSEPMKSYLVQKNKEAKEMFSSDGGLLISPTRLAERVIWAEEFIKENPNFYSELMEELKASKKMYLTYLFEGMDNTPLFDYQTKQLNQDFEEAYQTITSSYSDTETAAMIKPYYEAIKNKNTKKQDELMTKYQAEDKIYKNEY
ncbi:hypothetical protein Fleli_0541 [Bernardetia litoralis DSM 6794]|uniref:Uncharacterized protein n=1 Tax=Bernardetia litoralis (strain ATCC 23117 / DSM 6794 / NBRC 15988 / NCIMB 1366 / Fx l1 / Sio-4) TaxID=880071 RepID=I4AGC3_BERLS|nr:hypothetical protein [Bernardetia litoralis]AFM03008.1 hypothetical protein Fleli_0541 [Bernardetia litoralis DSM 6794]